jgi:FHA domain
MKNLFTRFRKEAIDTATNAAETAPSFSPLLQTGAFMPSTPALREAITGFIIQSLQPYVDEKAISIAGLHFYIVCKTPQEEEAARVALYTDRPGMFAGTLLERKMLNHFIQLSPNWYFECHVVNDHKLPENCIRKENFGLHIVRAGEPVTVHFSTAILEVLAGQAEQSVYRLDPQQQLKYCIGRTKTPQLSSGRIQVNDIVFIGSDEPGYNAVTGAPNNRVSRNHASIVFDTATGNWLLYPDKGGLPENGNKLKIHTAADKIKWLNIHGVSHSLADGDQVELGGEAIVRFRIPGK